MYTHSRIYQYVVLSLESQDPMSLQKIVVRIESIATTVYDQFDK